MVVVSVAGGARSITAALAPWVVSAVEVAVSAAADFPAAVAVLVAVVPREVGDVNTLQRAWRHAVTARLSLRRHFTPAVLETIEATVRACETRHPGEIRFAVEAGLSLVDVFAGLGPRERAEDLFSALRVWDTEHNNGVLIYVLMADRKIEIVVDRGVAGGHVPQSEWDACAEAASRGFRAGQFEQGAVAAIESVTSVLAKYPPGSPGVRPDVGNELPDSPVVL